MALAYCLYDFSMLRNEHYSLVNDQDFITLLHETIKYTLKKYTIIRILFHSLYFSDIYFKSYIRSLFLKNLFLIEKKGVVNLFVSPNNPQFKDCNTTGLSRTMMIVGRS